MGVVPCHQFTLGKAIAVVKLDLTDTQNIASAGSVSGVVGKRRTVSRALLGMKLSEFYCGCAVKWVRRCWWWVAIGFEQDQVLVDLWNWYWYPVGWCIIHFHSILGGQS